MHNGDFGALRSSSESLYKYCVNESDDEVELRILMSNVLDGVKKVSKHLHMQTLN